MREYAVTTEDNPFNPFTQFDDWFNFDCDKSYYTCNKIARLSQNQREDLDPIQQIIANNQVVDKLIACDFLGIYKRIERNVDLNSLA